MYWYTKKIKNNTIWTSLFTIGLVLLCMSCESPSQGLTSNNKQAYFDIPAYFENEISILQKSNPLVSKTVRIDKDTETKDLKISDWNDELSSFLVVDLNKPAYHGYIKKDSVNNQTTYTLSDNKTDLNKVTIKYINNIPSEFEISKTTKNFLYTTEELLTYKKGSMYSILKGQKIVLLGTNDFEIMSKIK